MYKMSYLPKVMKRFGPFKSKLQTHIRSFNVLFMPDCVSIKINFKFPWFNFKGVIK